MTIFFPRFPPIFRPLFISLCQLLFFFLLLNIGHPDIVLVTFLFLPFTLFQASLSTFSPSTHIHRVKILTHVFTALDCSFCFKMVVSTWIPTHLFFFFLPKLLYILEAPPYNCLPPTPTPIRNLGVTLIFFSFTSFLHLVSSQKLCQCYYPCFF